MSEAIATNNKPLIEWTKFLLCVFCLTASLRVQAKTDPNSGEVPFVGPKLTVKDWYYQLRPILVTLELQELQSDKLFTIRQTTRFRSGMVQVGSQLQPLPSLNSSGRSIQNLPQGVYKLI